MSIETPATPDNNRPGKIRILLAALPLVIFAGLAVIFWSQLDSGRDISEIPSALIGTKAPSLDLPPLEGATFKGAAMPALIDAAVKGKLTLVNVWASWCVPCHDEAPLLHALSEDKRFQIVGINYKDATENARRFLGRYGNPFSAVGVDANGRASIEWGVYGVPETFVVGRDGKIAYKLIGPITPQNYDTILKAEIEKALRAPL